MSTTRQYRKEDMIEKEGQGSNEFVRSPSTRGSQDAQIVQGNILIKSSSIGSKSSTHTCSSCGSPKAHSTAYDNMALPLAYDNIPSVRTPESPSALSLTYPLPLHPSSSHTRSSSIHTVQPESEYHTFLRQANKAHKRRSLDVHSMMLACEEVEPHRQPRKLLSRGTTAQDQSGHTHPHTHAHMHTHTYQRSPPEQRSSRATPRANSVQSDSGVDKLRESLRKKQTNSLPPSPPRRRLLDRGSTCTCQTPEALAPPGPSPGPGTYDLDDTFTHSKKTFTISPAPSPRFSTATSSSPGPGYYSPALQHSSPAFSIGSSSNITPTKKTLFTVRSETPGPGAYSTQSPVNSPRTTTPKLPPQSPHTPSPRTPSPYTYTSTSTPPPRPPIRRISLTDVKPKPSPTTRCSPSPTKRDRIDRIDRHDKLENGNGHQPKPPFSPPKSPTKRLLLLEPDESAA